MVNLIPVDHVIEVMNLTTHHRTSMNEIKNSDQRRLKRLRLLLILWIVSLLATIVWYSLSA